MEAWFRSQESLDLPDEFDDDFSFINPPTELHPSHRRIQSDNIFPFSGINSPRIEISNETSTYGDLWKTFGMDNDNQYAEIDRFIDNLFDSSTEKLSSSNTDSSNQKSNNDVLNDEMKFIGQSEIINNNSNYQNINGQSQLEHYSVSTETVPTTLTEDSQVFDYRPQVARQKPKRIQRQIKTKKSPLGHKRRRSEPIPQTESFFPFANFDVKNPKTASKSNFDGSFDNLAISSQLLQQQYNSGMQQLAQAQFSTNALQIPIMSTSSAITFPFALPNSLNALFPTVYMNQNDLSLLNQVSMSLPPSSLSQTDDSPSIRGKYKCGLCGKPKANHNCLFKTKIVTKNKGIQVDTKGVTISNNDQIRTISVLKKEEVLLPSMTLP